MVLSRTGKKGWRDSPVIKSTAVCLGVYLAVIKCHDHSKLGEKGFILTLVCSPSTREVRVGTTDRNLEAEIDAEATEKG